MELNMKLKTWMKDFEDEKLFDLILPGTHNSTSYDLSHCSILFGNRVSCQNQPILRQLEDGVRAIDLRVIQTLHRTQDSIYPCVEYWTGHGNRFVELELVLDTIFTFLKENPSEFVFLCVAPDATPMNDNRPFCSCFKPDVQILDRIE